jgi:hypothetical protein
MPLRIKIETRTPPTEKPSSGSTVRKIQNQKLSQKNESFEFQNLDLPTFGGGSQVQHNGCPEEQPWQGEGIHGS